MRKEERRVAPRRGHGPGHGPMMAEKPKDFNKSISQLFNYCKKYLIYMAIAIVLAIAGTVLNVLGPDKLSDITNLIKDGIMPDTDKISEVTEVMQENISTNFEVVVNEITEVFKDENEMSLKMQKIMTSSEISNEDKLALQNILTSSTLSEEERMNSLTSLNESITSILFEEITVNETVISVQDQITTLSLLSQASEDTSFLQNLPESVEKAIYTDIEVEGVTISAEDQMHMVEALSEVDVEDTQSAMDAMDKLPASVYSIIEPALDVDAVLSVAMILLAMYSFGFLCSAIQHLIMSTVSQNVSKSLRNAISMKINRLTLKYFDTTTTGDILSRVTNDVDTIGQTLNQSLSNLVSAIVMFAGSLFMMFKTNAIMATSGILATFAGFIFMFLIIGKSQKYFTMQQEKLGNINGHIEEMFTGHNVVKAYNGEKEAKRLFKEMNNDLYTSAWKSQFMSGLMQPIMGFIGNFGYVVVCVVGAVLVMNGDTDFGTIVAFMVYIRLFTNPLSQIAQAATSLQSTAAAAERVFEFLEEEEMSDESSIVKRVEHVEGNVTFDHVKFGYNPDKVIIKDFSAEIKAGQKVAIVGPTGAGKTTLVNLLMRFYEVNEGEIRIDNIPIKEITRENIHSLFGMVLQDTWLFEGSIKDNIVYSKENTSDETVIKICKKVGLHHHIKTLSKGYDTLLNDKANLSAGQKQLVTIARAMVENAPMIILDEATSSVDTRTEIVIQNAMDELMKGRTSFIIAHRLSTIKNADLILVLKDGDIIESGTHEALMEKKGFYCDLYNSQFLQTNN